MLSSVDVLGNLQYFRSEKAEDVRNLNYLERSVYTALYFTHGNSVSFTPQATFAPYPESKKGHRFSRAIGTTVDGVAHVTSRVAIFFPYDPVLPRNGIGIIIPASRRSVFVPETGAHQSQQ